MFLFTIIAEFRGGTYCSQVYAKDVYSAQESWVKRIERDKKEIKFLGDKIILEINLMLNGGEHKPIQLSNLNNIWCNTFSTSKGVFSLNIVKTNDQI